MITDSFDNQTKTLISLEAFYGEQRHTADRCLLVFSRRLHDELLGRFPCRQIGEIGSVNGMTPIWCFDLDGRPLAFYLSPVGSTMAAQYCIEANWICGATRFILFGSAGSLDAEKTAGRYVLPTEAYRDEGMSYHYAPPADYIAVPGHRTVAEFFREKGVPYAEGRVWTTDAFLRETSGQVARRRAEGCIAVEMEIAGVQAVCDFYGFSLYAFLETGDSFSDEAYTPEGLQEANHAAYKLQLALELARRL
ncbi:MAG: nucleoside phosphorylase [Oscillospiraceae bacterium]|nr:nucleoside phosphorylase [Oscillospiraceae bacterium]